MSTAAKTKDRKTRALAYIHKRIAEGVYSPGMRLDVNGLAKEIGVSATPVREAFSALESAGLVEHLPRFGVMIRRLSVDQVAGLYEVRGLLEGFAAEKAAERRTDAHLAEIRRQCDEIRRLLRRSRTERGAAAGTGDRNGWISADLAFHHAVLEASGNEELVRMTNHCRMLSQVFRLGRAAEDAEATYRNSFLTWWVHTRVYRAIQRKDAASAGRWMRLHLSDARAGILRLMRSPTPFIPWPPEDGTRVRELERTP